MIYIDFTMPNCVSNKELDDLIDKTTVISNAAAFVLQANELMIICDALRELRRARNKLAELSKKCNSHDLSNDEIIDECLRRTHNRIK